MSFRQLLREPLLHFFLLAALLFVIEQIASTAQRPRIVIDSRTADYLVQQREELELRTLGPAERAETIDAFVQDEILYREAYRQGLDRGDSRMRRNLILKMRGLLTGDPGIPTEDELRQFYIDNQERFTRPASLNLEQVYFTEPSAVPEGLLLRLRAGLNPVGIGEETLELRRRMPDLTRATLVGIFGPEAAGVIIDINDDQWHGPFESARGVHFVRILERTAELQASYESVRQYLQGDWLMEQSRQRIEAGVERLRDDYDIVIESGT